MRSKSALGIVLLCVLFLQACGQTTSKYQASAENVRMLKSTYSNATQKLQSLTLAKSQKETTTLGCRLADPIQPPGGLSFEQYVLGGLVDELKFAGLLSEKGTRSITAEFKEIDFNSVFGVWTISANFATEKGTSFGVKTEYEFESSSNAGLACARVTDAFTFAVRQFIQAVTQHKTFKSLMN